MDNKTEKDKPDLIIASALASPELLLWEMQKEYFERIAKTLDQINDKLEKILKEADTNSR